MLDSGALGLSYFPDEGTASLDGPVGSGPVRLILTAGTSTFLVEGDSLRALDSATEVVAPGPSGSFDNGYAGVSAVVRVGETFYGFYHAEDHEGLPEIPGGIPGYYASIGLVTSNDGSTWTKRGQVLTSNKPKEWQAYENQGDRGAAEPGAVVTTDGRYLLLYYTEHSRVDGRAVDICVARADLDAGAPLPGAFKKYYQGSFSEPGIGGRDTPVVTATHLGAANALEGHVTYSAFAERYLMVFGVDAYEERQAGLPATTSGIYAAWSSDGVAWSTPERWVADQAIPQTGMSLSWEASVLWDDDAGQTGTLVYGYTPSWPEPPHAMAGQKLTLEMP